MPVRIATSPDRDDIRAVHLAAFDEGEREVIAKLAIDLLSEETTPRTISLVAEIDGAVVGHVVFSPVTIKNGEKVLGYILAPLGVKPGYQKRHIGSELVKGGMERLSGMGVDTVLVYGDPGYYGRFGFGAEAAARFIPPYKLQYPFGWLGIVLNDRISVDSPAKITCVTSLSDPSMW